MLREKDIKSQSSIGRCKNSGDHPKEDLAKYGYKPNIKNTFLIFFPYF
jgi:hypothetical protein